MGNKGRSPRQRLQTLAASQQGLFTARQAIAAGFGASNHSYHVRRKNWVRERRGIYRLARMRRGQECDYVLWSLWSMDDSLSPQGVLSHDTALEIHGGSDVLPSKFHLSVPRGFGQRRRPKEVVLHRADLDEKDIEARDGYRVTTPLRTLLDCVKSLKVPDEIIAQALASYLSQGRVSLEAARAYSELEPHLSETDLHQETEPAYHLLRQYFNIHAPDQKLSEEELLDMAKAVTKGFTQIFGFLAEGWKRSKRKRQMRRTDRIRSGSESALAMEDSLAERIRAKRDPELLQLWLDYRAELTSGRKD